MLGTSAILDADTACLSSASLNIPSHTTADHHTGTVHQAILLLGLHALPTPTLSADTVGRSISGELAIIL